MKKIFAMMMVVACIGTSYGYKCMDMDDGTICLDIQNKGNGTYQIVKDFTPAKSKEVYVINCKILTPDGYQKDMGKCDGSFSYDGNGAKNITWYVTLGTQKKVMDMEYDFNKNYTPSSDTASSIQYNAGFTADQIQTVQNVFDSWPRLIKILSDRYTNLSKSTRWNNSADYIYDQMNMFLANKNSDIKSYQDFKTLIIKFVQLTKDLR